MTTTTRDPTLVCNTTPTRYFALTSQVDLLAQVCGGSIRVPRLVLDPDDDETDRPELQSEIGASERFWAKRATGPEAVENWLRLGALRIRTDIVVIDMVIGELERFAELVSRDTQERYGLAAPLGKGEAAVIAIAESRDWIAVMDDREGLRVLQGLSPSTRSMTTTDLLRKAVYDQIIDTGEADVVYEQMLDKGYWGPTSLWT